MRWKAIASAASMPTWMGMSPNPLRPPSSTTPWIPSRRRLLPRFEHVGDGAMREHRVRVFLHRAVMPLGGGVAGLVGGNDRRGQRHDPVDVHFRAVERIDFETFVDSHDQLGQGPK